MNSKLILFEDRSLKIDAILKSVVDPGYVQDTLCEHCPSPPPHAVSLLFVLCTQGGEKRGGGVDVGSESICTVTFDLQINC